MNAQQYKIALYGQGLFNSNDNRLNVRQANQLAESGFTTLMLFSLHVYPHGELYWGRNPLAIAGRIVYPYLDEQVPSLPQLLARLREGTVNTVLFSIGSAAAADWTHIQQLLADDEGRAELLRNFTAVADWLGLDGFDFDCEETVSDDTIAVMAELLAPVGRSHIITFCPYTDPDTWLARLQLVYARHGRQLVSWWNLQCYAGGSSNDPGDWIELLRNSPEPIGVTDYAAFIVPGFATDENGGPSGICTTLQKYQQLKLSGAFVWNSGGVLETDNSAAQYAKAVANGLSGQPCP